MESSTKRKLTEAELSAIARKALGQGASAAVELTDGWANAAYLVTLEDGKQVIVKAAPPAGTKLMSYERGLMKTEVEVLQLVKKAGNVPVPFVYAYDVSESLVNCEYFIMEKLEGEPYNKVKSSLTEEQQARIDYQLGVYNRELNEIRGERFGLYAAAEEVVLSWQETFMNLLLGVLADGEREGVVLPASYATIRSETAKRAAALDEITEPRLISWDLWDGNVFIKDGKVSGIIDFERALWGDPLMEHYFSHFNQSAAFLAGYGLKELSPEQLRRRALYDLYLDLIMCIECPFRQYEDEAHLQWAQDNVAQGWARFLEAAEHVRP
ncbi:aminoglycoside phosphotransferase (APT) family kinase protein [Paenibacillus endophyticus]|uniref:Aminoglycoside phosphotransferase (APT) family kinase protein n=1 Tax=Paenibacillus endophyticus TaxID=1294268 RepID=A0A7W5CD46_9BACL|nr:aminoglycoside phosphotransferase family protein [Paenibacillus endophyticus]MBB3155523.1 aminoglycoside phosphotransferase (APT) family kinase protein [Paenibacillus endophyticus]